MTRRRGPTLREQAKNAQRRMLLDAARRILAEEGLGALTLRRLAAEVGASTTAAYTHFGGKEGVVHALYLEAFESLGDALEAVPRGDDVLRHLREMGTAYRRHALAHPTDFALIAGPAVPHVAPPSARAVRETRAYRCFVQGVREGIAARRLVQTEPEIIADALWATALGMVSLELAGYFPSRRAAEARFLAAIDATARGFLAAGA